MHKRTLILILVLIGITAVLLAIALTPKQNPVTPPQKPSEQNLSLAQTILRISPPVSAIQTSTVSASPLYSSEVTIQTGGNKVTGVQLELSYDIAYIANFDIEPGPFFKNAGELIKKIDPQKGTVSYAITVPLSEGGVTGGGTVAVISFRQIGTPGEFAKINFLPKTQVASETTDKSVLKTAIGTTFMIEGASPPPINTGTPSAQ
ncbi:MAG: hypothetical protein A2958_02175 [Candidatus Levybacteria bacterium RIFCSPLOWO2_01_FULL_38_13]|nr:MAG: hypothetical protein A2629_03805 [Candidatus Levybacteria bacterium RIFCSPHIGHO2_01_FULL_41_15]OGH35057.1 MAG: hypothetical protein A2958_02175 [Candidatus Levybacteria bacterium RIFCSPLOWO2_01_FULL_38_13]